MTVAVAGLRDPRIARDDVAHIHGMIAVVVDADNRFRALFIRTGGGGKGGVISSLDPDAGTYFVDELEPATKARPMCSNCSRVGHTKICENAGVATSDQHRRQRRSRVGRKRRERPGADRHAASS